MNFRKYMSNLVTSFFKIFLLKKNMLLNELNFMNVTKEYFQCNYELEKNEVSHRIYGQ